MRGIVAATLVATLAVAGAARARSARAQEQQPSPLAPRPSPPGSFVSHPEHIQPGLTSPPAGLALRNPYEGNAQAAANGARLFIAYNCLDCHGAEGSGAMGPSLADNRWHFGGAPNEIYESIYQGRPEGMPAWGNLISSDQIWQLVAYVRSLGANKDVTSENFSGATVERTGH